MRSSILIPIIFLSTTIIHGQNDSLLQQKNSAEHLLNFNKGISLGGYGQIDYNQPLDSKTKQLGTLDVHRLVLLLGYAFNSKTKLIAEIEFEHVKEVYIEQAFLQHQITDLINFRTGLLLVPMGIINEYHEPNTFHGVERPLIDKYIVPTTWREIGAGFTGTIIPASIKYQFFVVNGFASYNKEPKLNGLNGLRSGRQKGAESIINSPNFAGKVEWFSIPGLNIGISGYFGKTQSNLYQDVNKSNTTRADSSVVGIAMFGADLNYSKKGLEFITQWYYSSMSNTREYNYFTASANELNDLGNAMLGYYFQLGYDLNKIFVLKQIAGIIPFIRYEHYNTHFSIDERITKNKNYNVTSITAGLSFKINSKAVLKADLQYLSSAAESNFTTTFNTGVGFMF